MDNPIPDCEDDPALLNHIYVSYKQYFIDSMSDETKSRMVKDGLIKSAIDIVDKLNGCFPDVKFDIAWQRLYPHQNYSFTQYDKRWCSDEDYLNIDCAPYDLDLYYRLPVEEMGLEIKYTWERRCSLGCVHYQRRYHLFSAPQWLTMMSQWLLKPDPLALIKEYLPDFFYDPK